MIKRYFLYKVTRRGGEARSSEKCCREDREQGRGRESEWEPETGAGTGIGMEIGIAAANGGIGMADANGDGIGGQIGGRETGKVQKQR